MFGPGRALVGYQACLGRGGGQALSVKVPSEAAAKLFMTDAEHFNSLLRKIPREQDLWQVRRLDVDVGSPADDLHRALRKMLPDVDWVTAGKLIAAKRPRLTPYWTAAYKTCSDRHRNYSGSLSATSYRTSTVGQLSRTCVMQRHRTSVCYGVSTSRYGWLLRERSRCRIKFQCALT